MKTESTVALIDADILVYQVATMVERPIDWGNDVWTLHSTMTDAVSEIEAKIRGIKTVTKADEVLFTLSCSDGKYFRKEVYPKYKLNRKSTRKPLVWRPLREWLYENHPHSVWEKPGLEGDDCLGILATKKHWPGNPKRILVSIDKDFKTIPCTFYDMNKQTTMTMTEHDANYWFMFQTLTGDTTDGYPGCPGIGPKTAEKMLAGCWYHGEFDMRAAWDLVVDTYKQKGLGVGVALQMARCARILRAEDYSFSENKPKLWEPPTS